MVCCCSLAGTKACYYCSNNPNAETPPIVRTNTAFTTNPVLITGIKTNADRIRSMTDEELAEWLKNIDTAYEPETIVSQRGWIDWLKQEVEE